MPNVNPGPALCDTANTQAMMGPPGSSGAGGSGQFNVPLSVALAGTVNDWSPTGWTPGVTNLLSITPTGTPTVNGINTFGMASGQVFLVYNASTTLSILFANLAAGSLSTNQVACPGAGTVALGPQTATQLTFNGTNLIFAS